MTGRREPAEIEQPANRSAFPPEEFVAWIAGSQRSLYAYIFSLVGSRAEVDDILQEVNLVLWRKAHEYDRAAPFLAWAFRVAYFEVLAYLKRRRRDRHTYFDESVLADLAEGLVHKAERMDARWEALGHCLGKLPPEQRRMITARYAPEGSVQTVARELGRLAGSVRVSLHRIRAVLLECMKRTLAAEGSA